MKLRMTRVGITLFLATLLTMGASTPAWAVTKCSAKFDPKDGTIAVSASDVSGTLLWGNEAGAETNPFSNAGSCVSSGKAKTCVLAPEGDPQRITPPRNCTLFLKDDGDATTCAAYLKKCTPGLRESAPPPANSATFAANNGIPNLLDFYVHPSGTASSAAATIFNEQVVMAKSCTFDALRVVLRSTNTNAPNFGPDRLFTFTLNVDGMDTSLACSAMSLLNSNTGCTSGNAVAVGAGQLVAVHVTAQGALPTPGGRLIISLHCQ